MLQNTWSTVGPNTRKSTLRWVKTDVNNTKSQYESLQMKGYKGDKTIKMTEKWERQNLLLNKYKNRNKSKNEKIRLLQDDITSKELRTDKKIMSSKSDKEQKTD